ncbi:tetratricopeptide repeat protein [Pseudenhygromyxa sp. WMMC2535]|uniref:tetratricopeptide repeat protein n=1 Tax=Pseudenhygromyxa sp. WMMC2535 TaxID=2712867 RepID=UPI00159555C8|nr:tetratricopeptide repeat protein [Pseudenhygromyxa sp. WMMC2535]NVB43295.1 tetratricopeptide repeat protein [Pseudenhygromyxa sp. WMMC2535]
MHIRKPQRLILSSLVLILGAATPACGGSLSRAQDALVVGDEAKAEVELRKALKSNSTHDEAARMLSILLADQGDALASSDPREAEQRFDEALDLDPSNEKARLGLARLLMKRGFEADARELLAFEGCTGCGRLEAMMLHESAVAAYQAGDIDTARQLFKKAFDQGKDPLDALGLATTYLASDPPDVLQAKAMLETAAPLVARGQHEAERLFRELRANLLMAVAAAGQSEMIDQIFNIRSAELLEEPEFELRFKVSQEQFRNGDSDPAIARITSLLEKSGQYLEPTQREVMEAALVVMFSARAAQHLQAGDEVGAAKDIAAGLKIDDDNSRLRLQQVLAIAANRLPLAFTKLEEAKKNGDRDKVEAILHALQTFEHLDAGSTAKALNSLEQAEALGPKLPEVHLARAYVLAEQRNEDLRKNELKDVRKNAGFDYPRGRVNQFPSALAHLAHAKALLAKQGVLFPFRGAGFDKRAADLEQALAFYPYEVDWYADKGGVIEIVAAGGRKEVEFKGPRWLKGTAIASPDNAAEIQVPNVGLVYLEYEGKELGVVVEENTRIQIQL